LTNKARKIAEIDPALREAIRALVAGNAPWPLCVMGPAGCGKTCASLCVLDHLHRGFYYTAESLCETVIQAQQGDLFSPNGRKVCAATLWEELQETPLVVLDEIGSRDRVSDFHFNTIKRVLDIREGRPLICLSNLNLVELSKIYDDRVVSRLVAGTVVMLKGEDRRVRSAGSK
jgi:DNA replication protein DnaC